MRDQILVTQVGQTPINRRQILIGAAACLLSPASGAASAAASPQRLAGAGATLATRLFESWGKQWAAEVSGQLVYASVGSTQGIDLFETRGLDFAASEIALPADIIDRRQFVQFPAAHAAIVLGAHLPGLGERVKLTPSIVSAIYRGDVRHWRHPAIADLNTGIVLPDLMITPVSRLGSSGSTYSLTNYLSDNDNLWATTIGRVDTPEWGYGLLAKGTWDMQAVVASTPGSVGYWLRELNPRPGLTEVMLEDETGSFAAAPTQGEGIGRWPLTSTIYVVLQRPAKTPDKKLASVGRFFWLALTQWQANTLAAGFQPLASDELARVLRDWEHQGLNMGTGK